MANSRIITSAIWEDEWFGPLSFFEQSLWVGLFSRCADDQGRLLDNPVVIRAAVFPYKDVSVDEIDAAVAGFAEARRIHRYQADGKALIQITNWWEHQRQQWASASKWLPPAGWQDHVRTRQNNDMLTVNWLGKDQNYTQHVGWVPVQVNAQVDVQVNAQVAGHIPIPVPTPIPVPDPIPSEKDCVPAPKPEPEKEPAKRRRQQTADTRTKHPAILCVSGIMSTPNRKRNPPVVVYDDLIATLGNTPDGAKLHNCFKEWCARGYKAENLGWALDWYPNGIPGRTGNGSRASPRNNGTPRGVQHIETDPEFWAAEAERVRAQRGD